MKKCKKTNKNTDSIGVSSFQTSMTVNYHNFFHELNYMLYLSLVYFLYHQNERGYIVVPYSVEEIKARKRIKACDAKPEDAKSARFDTIF